MSFVENFITTSMATLVAGVVLIGFSKSETGKIASEVLGAKIDNVIVRVFVDSK